MRYVQFNCYRFTLHNCANFAALVEKHAMVQSPKRIEELVKIFKHATKVSVLLRFVFLDVLKNLSDGDRLLEYGRNIVNH